jgi:hypothetical protein
VERPVTLFWPDTLNIVPAPTKLTHKMSALNTRIGSSLIRLMLLWISKKIRRGFVREMRRQETPLIMIFVRIPAGLSSDSLSKPIRAASTEAIVTSRNMNS